MRSRVLLAVVASVALPSLARAQHPSGLATLIPNLYGSEGLFVESEARLPDGSTHSAHFNSAFQSQFTQFNIALASQLASIPLPSPASGFTYEFEPTLGIFQRTTDSFGPVYADRAETIGKGKFTISTAYQNFRFDRIEGLDLDSLPAVFTHDGAAPGGRADVVTTTNSIDASVDQFAFFATYGLTARLDVSLAVPFVNAKLTVVSDTVVRRIGTAANPAVHFFEQPEVFYGDERTFVKSDTASGVGDLIVRLKGTALKKAHAGLALALDFRFPTGDELDLLGSGAWGLKPFAAFSWSGRVSPHLNLGYQWNGNSVLAGDVMTGRKADVPDQLLWTAGLDIAVSRRMTLAADFLGRRVFDSPRLESTTFHALDGATTFPDIRFETASFNEMSGAVGLKLNAVGNMLIDFNVLFALDNNGLRDKLIPLVGIEYTF
jgi:hypothetical protein